MLIIGPGQPEFATRPLEIEYSGTIRIKHLCHRCKTGTPCQSSGTSTQPISRTPYAWAAAPCATCSTRMTTNVPFFSSRVLPEAQLSFSPVHSESHVPGRHLNALLNAEDAIGIELDERCIDNHANAAFLAYGGPVALPINRDGVGGPQVNFTPHNCREGLHALYPLVRFRHSERARAIAEDSIRTIPKYWSPINGWGLRLPGRRTRTPGPSLHVYRRPGTIHRAAREVL